jgi:hypothetical protein
MKKLIIVSSFMFMGLFAKAQITVSQEQKLQSNRISQGVATGELTLKETNQLFIQQNQIERQKKRAKADGVVTKRERARLKYRQVKASTNIYRKKHNAINRNYKGSGFRLLL